MRAPLLALALLAPGVAAAADLSPFIGTFVGTAEVIDPQTGAVTERRDMDIVVEPYRKYGLQIRWINVSLVDGRRDVPGVERRVQQVLFLPADDGDFLVEVPEYDPFRRRDETDPMRGDPVRWARVDGDALQVFTFGVRDDGTFEMQVYERVRTEIGMEIEFRRIVDGVVDRRVIGRTVAVADEEAAE